MLLYVITVDMFSKYIPKMNMQSSQFTGDVTGISRMAFKNPLCNDSVNTNAVSRYSNIVKNVNKPKIIVNPIKSNNVLPGWVSLAKVNGRTEITYGIAREGFRQPEPLRTYDELLDSAYCRAQQRYWDNDIKLKGALSVYYCKQTLDEWAKCEEEARIQQQLECIAYAERDSQLLVEDKANCIKTDSEMKRIKKNARIILSDNDTHEYQSD